QPEGFSMKTYLIAAAALIGAAGVAHAQTSRIYATQGGSGACDYASPCASLLDAAIALPPAGGIVQLLAPGYYGNVTNYGTASFNVEGAGIGSVINGFGLAGTGQTGTV